METPPFFFSQVDIMKYIKLSALAALVALSACSSLKSEATFPKEDRDQRADHRGSLSGDSGLLIAGNSDSEATKGSPLGVNSFLWRATLDTLSFMPLASADPFGGVIITDWYEDPAAPGERFKVNAVILDKTLRSDGIKITVFKQKLDKNSWRDQKVDDKLARKLEDAVLTRARQLKIKQTGK